MASTLPSAKELMERACPEGSREGSGRNALAGQGGGREAGFDDRLKDLGVSDEEAMRRVKVIIERAVNNGLSQVQVYRFPNSLCTDRGRAINQQEADFASTLTGLPRKCTISGDAS